MKKIRVNVRTAVANESIRRETRNGREVIIVPSATMPDNVVMNGIRYPAEEIHKSYGSLERSLAPLHHPVDADDNFLSANDPEALNGYYFGAYNSDVTQKDGRVFLDKVIDVKRAQESDRTFPCLIPCPRRLAHSLFFRNKRSSGVLFGAI